jgi:hypothetical protein
MDNKEKPLTCENCGQEKDKKPLWCMNLFHFSTDAIKDIVWRIDKIWAHVPSEGGNDPWTQSKARGESRAVIEELFNEYTEHASQQTEALQAEIERLKKRLDKDINALLHLGMVKDEQIERLKNIIKDGKLGN